MRKQGIQGNNILQKVHFSIDQCISNTQSLHKYACEICYDIKTGICVCAGPCSKYYCIDCVSDCIKTSNKCPSRCSEPFKVKPAHNISFTFKCPFNPNQCKDVISSISDFDKHYHICKQITQKQLQRLNKKFSFLCKEGHHLQICKYIIGSSSKQQHSQKCGQCEQTLDSRSFCRICHQFYCLKCRPIPCTKQGCPIGHKFKIQRKKQSNKGRKFVSDRQVCSVCGLSLFFTEKNYHDLKCQIRVCSVCYQKLPDSGNKNNVLFNDYETCFCKKKVTYQKYKIAQKTQCSICKRNRMCPKACLTCQNWFCLECKPVKIDRKKLCPNGHLYKKVYNPLAVKNRRSAKRKFVNQVPANRCCLVCFKVETWLFQDKGCNIILCENCFRQSINLNYDHHVPLQDILCKHGHKLEYFNDVLQRQDDQDVLIMNYCKICHQQHASFLQCEVCEREGQQEQVQAQAYCINCRPIQFSTCYLGHPLLPFPIYNLCLKCEQPMNNTFSCKQCNFQICWDCRTKSMKINADARKYFPVVVMVFLFIVFFLKSAVF